MRPVPKGRVPVNACAPALSASQESEAFRRVETTEIDALERKAGARPPERARRGGTRRGAGPVAGLTHLGEVHENSLFVQNLTGFLEQCPSGVAQSR